MTSINRVQVGKPAPDFNCTAVVDGRLKGNNTNYTLLLIRTKQNEKD